ncbi:MAG TPA: ribonuclease domain-containing protein [Patescibacteria group bacterium]|nr:ribonuclease domain-containing protein [Patescibacteria group bacterium]
MHGHRVGVAAIAAALLVVLAGIVAIQIATDDSVAKTGTIEVSSGTPGSTRDPASGLPTIARSTLPVEARSALELIAADGPFPYDQDGSPFQNRERLLPIRPAGTYREYTVETPGSPDRGARRIVIASTGEAYWTPDHYASFARIVP